VQDRWLALIENGCVPPLDYYRILEGRDLFQEAELDLEQDGKDSDEAEPEDLKKFINTFLADEELRRWQKYSLRKLEVLARSGKPETLEASLKNHEAHYARFFAKEGEPLPHVALMRGGFSANEAVINAIADLSKPSEKKAYIMDGWYYENRKSITEKFDVVDVPGEANILCINSAPNGYIDPNLSEHYPEERDKLISSFIQNAALHPEEKYFILVDKTTDLFYNPAAGISKMPDNVLLFETSSISKHQRGGHNYFFGSIEYRGKENYEEFLHAQVKNSRGELSPLAILNFPRLRRSEEERHVERLQELEKNFLAGFAEAQADLPSEARYTVQHNNGYCVLLVPPFDFLLKITSDSKQLRYYAAVDEYAIGGENDPFSKKMESLGFVRGDSFGFEEGRYSNPDMVLPEKLGIKEDIRKVTAAGKLVRSKFPFFRISFGGKNTKEQARDLGIFIGRTLTKNLPLESRMPES